MENIRIYSNNLQAFIGITHFHMLFYFFRKTLYIYGCQIYTQFLNFENKITSIQETFCLSSPLQEISIIHAANVQPIFSIFDKQESDVNLDVNQN